MLTAIGPTPDENRRRVPNAVREWCINTAAVNPADQQHFHAERGWPHLPLEPGYQFAVAGCEPDPGVGEPYVPTVIGPDGIGLYAQRGHDVRAGRGLAGESVRLTSSAPDLRGGFRANSDLYGGRGQYKRFGFYAHRYSFVSGYGVHSHGTDNDAARNRGPRWRRPRGVHHLSPQRRAAFHYCCVQR